MKEDRKVLIENSLHKSRKSLESAKFLIDNKDIDAAFNRIYYSIFYSVMALGYNYGFITSKHRQLMGWFNNKFINEKKLFSDKMYKIYKTAYDNRQDSDYNLIVISEKNFHEAEESLNDAVYFVNQIVYFLEK